MKVGVNHIMSKFQKLLSVTLVLITLLLVLNYFELREISRLQRIIINGVFN